MVLSGSVDPGWHAFMLHSHDYTRFCEENLGYYLHQALPAPGVRLGEEEITQILPALHATGYRVDLERWTCTAYPCCPPNSCVVKAAGQARHARCGGTGAPPPARSPGIQLASRIPRAPDHGGTERRSPLPKTKQRAPVPRVRDVACGDHCFNGGGSPDQDGRATRRPRWPTPRRLDSYTPR